MTISLTSDSKRCENFHYTTKSVGHANVASMTASSYWQDHFAFTESYIDDLRKGKIGIRGDNFAFWKGEDSWQPNNANPTDFFRLHSFGFLNPLQGKFLKEGDPSIKELASSVINSWCSSFATEADEPAWGAHQTALRAINLCNAIGLGLVDLEPHVALLQQHLMWLGANEHYDGAWNHGLDQSIALLDLGNLLQSDDAITLGSRRICDAIKEYADEQGVISEQATHYAGYMYRRLKTAEDKIQSLTGSVPKDFDRIHLIPDFTAWATNSIGFPVAFGDTMPGSWKPEARPTIDVPASPLVSGIKVYRDGWLFIRDGYEHTDASHRSHLATRYGTFRRIHGHRDHLSVVWTDGTDQVLCDPGFSGYNDKVVRSYEQLEHGHNGPIATGLGHFKWEHGAKLNYASTSFVGASAVPLYSFGIAHRAYEHGARERQVVFVPEAKTLVIADWLHPDDSKAEVSLASTWLFTQGTSLDSLTGSTDVVRINVNNRVLRMIQVTPTSKIEAFYGSHEPRLGWIATANGTSVPSLAVRKTTTGKKPVSVTVFSLDNALQANAATSRDTITVQLRHENQDLLHIAFRPKAPAHIIEVDPLRSECFNHN
ncbi:heparinase II/III family protein [Corynebacterium choanae]|uniref:Heparinase II/III-like C-terminal domain-containing protein n=1 Tax=Corynebacterium choanae TaxID=1862358 RepID=A0A3G6J5Y8_9CORY|nr:heparinase II/III family protein [Corynebacterium choanae]AZA13242.1 hypothetical protein CCHOA_04165 [Corynebacterium choanae]